MSVYNITKDRIESCLINDFKNKRDFEKTHKSLLKKLKRLKKESKNVNEKVLLEILIEERNTIIFLKMLVMFILGLHNLKHLELQLMLISHLYVPIHFE